LAGALSITGVPEATEWRNEDGTYHVKLTATVAGETGFKGSLAIEVQNATKPVTVKKEFTDEEENQFIVWLMENGIAECTGMELDENDPCIIHTSVRLNITSAPSIGVFIFGGEEGE
jgi:hypothetical protein